MKKNNLIMMMVIMMMLAACSSPESEAKYIATRNAHVSLIETTEANRAKISQMPTASARLYTMEAVNATSTPASTPTKASTPIATPTATPTITNLPTLLTVGKGYVQVTDEKGNELGFLQNNGDMWVKNQESEKTVCFRWVVEDPEPEEQIFIFTKTFQPDSNKNLQLFPNDQPRHCLNLVAGLVASVSPLP